jgi:hypothetical protein
VEHVRAPDYLRRVNVEEETMPTKTRSIAILAALTLGVGACADHGTAPRVGDPLEAATRVANRLAGATQVVTDPKRFVASAHGLYVDDASAEERLAGTAFVAGAARTQAGTRTTVLEFRDARSARLEAERLLEEAYKTPRDALVCDLHKETLSVAGIPGASGVIVDIGNATGGPTKLATIVFSAGHFAFHLSAKGEAGAVPVAQLERAARRAYLG